MNTTFRAKRTRAKIHGTAERPRLSVHISNMHITAQIIIQLLQMDIVPKYVEWGKQGEVGRRKLNQHTRYLTVVLAFFQSVGITAGFNQLSSLNLVQNPSIKTFVIIGIILTGGTMLTTWMGDMITERGLGNGISMKSLE